MIRVTRLRKEYQSKENQEPVLALKDISFEIGTGEIFTLLGPSGCGKTTTLRSIAGLERPNGGQIQIGEQIVFDGSRNHYLPAEKRGLGMVFQSYAIWPHMTVGQNVAYPLENKKLPKKEIVERVRASLKKVGLEAYINRLAPNLSGGQQQRIALARALVAEPEVLLLDEPLSNLDAKLREQMRIEIKHIQQEFGLTTVYVTHDQEEALALSDQIALMKDGNIVELGKPFDLYDKPKNRFTASFIGYGNFIKSELVQLDEDMAVVQNSFGRFNATSRLQEKTREVDLFFRPHYVSLYRDKPDQELNVGEGVVTDLIFLGETIEVFIRSGEDIMRIRSHPSFIPHEGERLYFTLQPDKSFVFHCESEASSNNQSAEAEKIFA
ncbi:iron(III) transport system ATP-binding protein [Neobacillus niacini]|uniref:ABC transporter ATP-binding protein n=1 Tax=Neobacillus niacini TaxID=86668 RepID=UPI0028572ECE|nr:ABC transporter ATP-binding protein [Neobacillus niacini]MDR7075860.1 iron(III) transport system ATP-binding protein [Neobacillus niacini]